MMTGKRKRMLLRLVFELILVVCLSLILIVPLLIMVLGSFKDPTEVTAFDLSLPKKWLFENYAIVFEEAKLGTAFFNGIFISNVQCHIRCFCYRRTICYTAVVFLNIRTHTFVTAL